MYREPSRDSASVNLAGTSTRRAPGRDGDRDGASLKRYQGAPGATVSGAARDSAERKAHALDKLREDADVWVSTASTTGRPYLVPLSLAWDGNAVVVATEARSVTARNAGATGRARLGLGPTRDVVMIDADVEVVPASAATAELTRTFVERTGWPPHPPEDWVYLVLRPRRVQAWQEANEIEGRDLMRDGEWLA